VRGGRKDEGIGERKGTGRERRRKRKGTGREMRTEEWGGSAQ
jgi:hypothetical protein